ncbi:MAG: formyltransferase [Herminiimonas sp.]|nr:formyltransferase [Herminiimonas sp.]
MRAVVFAYHDVGVRCLKVLLARGVEVALVVTHIDNPAETIWFASVAGLCAEAGIACITPADPSAPEVMAQVQAARPDLIFSFYYRHMLPLALLQVAPRGAYNMHGSLLPKYRGRVPINWAVLHGETETGATLHAMAAKPDAGSIVDQTMVPILPDDTASEVFAKVVVAAEQTLWRALPLMLAGRTPSLPNDLSQGSYFGGRNAEDGRIDWSRPAQEVYNLIRAVAPPYPGAWCMVGPNRCIIDGARLTQDPSTAATKIAGDMAPGLRVVDNRVLGYCGDGRAILVKQLRVDARVVTATELQDMLITMAS